MMTSHREATDKPGSGGRLLRHRQPARTRRHRGGAPLQVPAPVPVSVHEGSFGLHSPPFRLLPEARFYLQEGQYATVLATLLDGLEAGEACLLLTGAHGTGKTAAAQRLQTLLDRSRWVVGSAFASTSTAGEDALLAAVQAFGLVDADGPPGPALDAWLLGQAAQGRRVLLVVDEAQRLEDAALRQLAERLAPPGSPPRLQLCLVGEQAPATLAGAQRDGSLPPVAVQCRLRALDASETRDYVLHRLRCAGWQGRPSFDRAALDAIHRLSEGIPRRVHVLANGVLLQLSIDGVEAASAATVETAAQLRTAELHDHTPSEAEVPAAAPAASAPPGGLSLGPAAAALLLVVACIGIVGSAWWLGDGGPGRAQIKAGSTEHELAGLSAEARARQASGTVPVPPQAVAARAPAPSRADAAAAGNTEVGEAVAASDWSRAPTAQPVPAHPVPASPPLAACAGPALALGLCEPAGATPPAMTATPAEAAAPCEPNRAALGLCER